MRESGVFPKGDRMMPIADFRLSPVQINDRQPPKASGGAAPSPAAPLPVGEGREAGDAAIGYPGRSPTPILAPFGRGVGDEGEQVANQKRHLKRRFMA